MIRLVLPQAMSQLVGVSTALFQGGNNALQLICCSLIYEKFSGNTQYRLCDAKKMTRVMVKLPLSPDS